MLERMEKKKPEGHLEYKCLMNFKDNNIHCFQLDKRIQRPTARVLAITDTQQLKRKHAATETMASKRSKMDDSTPSDRDTSPTTDATEGLHQDMTGDDKSTAQNSEDELGE